MTEAQARKLRDLPENHRVLLVHVANFLTAALSNSGLTQDALAKELGENRTTISHIINSVKPTTKNPVFKSVSLVEQVQRSLLLWNRRRSGERAPKEAKAVTVVIGNPARDLLAALDQLINDRVERALQKRATPTPTKRATPKPRPNRRTRVVPAVGQVWKPKDKRRSGDRVEIVATHKSKDPKRQTVTVRSLKTKIHSQSSYEGFRKRYEYTSTFKNRLK